MFLERLGFDVVGLLLQISQELIDQLHIDANDDSYLLFQIQVIKEYFEPTRVLSFRL
jgi:hypothetical protein